MLEPQLPQDQIYRVDQVVGFASIKALLSKGAKLAMTITCVFFGTFGG